MEIWANTWAGSSQKEKYKLPINMKKNVQFYLYLKDFKIRYYLTFIKLANIKN